MASRAADGEGPLLTSSNETGSWGCCVRAETGLHVVSALDTELEEDAALLGVGKKVLAPRLGLSAPPFP